MSLIKNTCKDNKLHIRCGLNGNVYAFSLNKKLVSEVADLIGKSTNSVYYNNKLGVWAIRCKSKLHKKGY